MKFQKTIDKLCTPAYFYFLISTIIFVMLLTQNLFNGKVNELCAGSFTCIVSNVMIVFILKALYIVFWTFVLHSLCKYGYENLSWFLVLFPFLLFAVMLGLMVLQNVQ